MSSAAYEAELIPTRALRRLLLASAVGANLIGHALIIGLPLVPLVKAPLGLLWMLAGVVEVRRFRRGMSRIDRIGIRADGSIRGHRQGGTMHALEIEPGSVVLRRVAWLRLSFPDGSIYGELLTGRASEDEQWRRFLVIWRHRRTFGRSRGS